MQRLLICECGNTIVVGSAQAGRHVVCPTCQKTIQIPTLRGLAELPAAEPIEQNDQPTIARQVHDSRWRWRGPVMAGCLAVFLISLGFAFFNLQTWYNLRNYPGMEEHFQIVTQVLDEAGPDQLSQIWDDYSGVSLIQPDPPPYKRVRDFAQAKLRSGQIASGVSLAMLIGLLVIWRTAPKSIRNVQ